MKEIHALLTRWRAMCGHAYRDGPIPGDEVGHVSRWTAVEMCAAELEWAIRRDHPVEDCAVVPADGML